MSHRVPGATDSPAGGAADGTARAARRWGGGATQRWLTTAARVGLGVVLIVAGWIKISSPDDAVRAVQAYQILPQALTHAFGYGLPLLEILLGLLLVLGLGTRWAAIGAGVLMVVFIAGIISVWVRGLSIDCGCFGGGGTVSAVGRGTRYATEIARDLLFVGLASWTAAFPLSRLSMDGLLATQAGTTAWRADDEAPDGDSASGSGTGAGEAADSWDDEPSSNQPPQERRS